MLALFALHLACTSVGLPGELCQAIAIVESGVRSDVRHRSSAVGLMGVKPAFSPVPAWALRTDVGGAIGGALALAYWRERKGPAFLRGYACGNVATARACLRYEQRVLALAAKLRRVPRDET